MSLYRSQEMKLYKLGVKKDMIWEVINQFGKTALAHFIDLNAEESPMSLPYTTTIKECEYAEKRLQYLRDQCNKHYVDIHAPKDLDNMQEIFERFAMQKEKAESTIREVIQDDIRQTEQYCLDQNEKVKKTFEIYEQLKNSRAVFEMAVDMIPNLDKHVLGQKDIEGGRKNDGDDREALIDAHQNMNTIDISYIAGVIAQEDINRLKRLIFRSTKGKSFIHIKDYTDHSPVVNEKQTIKSCYIIMFWDGKQIRDKIEKICDSFNGQRFVLPPMTELPKRIQEVKEYITDARSNYEATKTQLRYQLQAFNTNDGNSENKISTFYIYKLFIAKEKAIFRTINMMRLRGSAEQFVGFFWCPVVEFPTIERITQDSRFTNAIEPITVYDNHSIEPPTNIPSTDLTWLSQQLVDLYGIPHYQEANPMIISLVTFPFLFGMMFGDIGHGSILLAFALFTLYQGEKGPLAKGRYMLTFMGISAVYCGLIYNEFFALKLNLWESCYDMEKKIRWTPSQSAVPHAQDKKSDWVFQRNNFNCTYPIGQDPVWGLTGNGLAFANGIKMKMSVIFGVLHMMIGVAHKYTNAIYIKRWASLITECIGGSIILLFLFGWMDLLIYEKWLTPINIQDRQFAQQVPVWELQLPENKGKTFQSVCPKSIPPVKFSCDACWEMTTVKGVQTAKLDSNGWPVFQTAPKNCTVAAMKNCKYAGDYTSQRAGNVISIMITTTFSGGSIDPCSPESTNIPYVGATLNQMFSTSSTLLYIVIVCIPLYLFVIPCCFRNPFPPPAGAQVYEEADADGDFKEGGAINASDASLLPADKGDASSIALVLKDMSTEYHAHEFGEAFIHQLIETIEFVLGTVSNTASYLRLWALSLAHGQLSEVFFNLILAKFVNVFNSGAADPSSGAVYGWTVVTTFLMWPAFWSVTFSVIMCMDQMECFLHCLRLHWVEMQNKFFKGDGYAFTPLSTKNVLAQAQSG